MQEKLQKEHAEWENLRNKGYDEVDTTDISVTWSGQSTYAKELEKRMKQDITELREIIGDNLTTDDLNHLAQSNPNILVKLLWKLFDLLRFLARIVFLL